MKTTTLAVAAAFLLVPALAPTAAAFPYPIFDVACPEYPDYVIVQYVLHPYANYCLGASADEGPAGTYPDPYVTISFPDTCVGDACIDRVCSPSPYRVCWEGTPTPSLKFYDREYSVPILTGVHGWAELTAVCGGVTPCRVDYDVRTSGEPAIVLS